MERQNFSDKVDVGLTKERKVKNDSTKFPANREKQSSKPQREDKKRSMFKEEDKLGLLIHDNFWGTLAGLVGRASDSWSGGHEWKL